MPNPNQPDAWQFNAQDTYVPVTHEDRVIGFCKPDYAARLVKVLNQEDKIRKALHLACYDLVARAGGNTSQVDDLVARYLAKAEPPKQGTALLADFLRERQIELDLNDEEFAKFCDSYRLSREELKRIFAGEDIEYQQLGPLSRILGRTIDDLITAWKGSQSH